MLLNPCHSCYYTTYIVLPQHNSLVRLFFRHKLNWFFSLSLFHGCTFCSDVRPWAIKCLHLFPSRQTVGQFINLIWTDSLYFVFKKEVRGEIVTQCGMEGCDSGLLLTSRQDLNLWYTFFCLRYHRTIQFSRKTKRAEAEISSSSHQNRLLIPTCNKKIVPKDF